MAGTRKYKRIYRYPKQKWSPVIKAGNGYLNQTNTAQLFDLVVNSTDTATPTPVVIKVKHLQVRINVNETISPSQVMDSVYFGAIYVPEGITVTNLTQLETLIASHPEWVMCYSIADGGISTSSSVVTSPLTRNLNSGDAIKMFVYYKAGGGNQQMYYGYIARWVNRAN